MRGFDPPRDSQQKKKKKKQKKKKKKKKRKKKKKKKEVNTPWDLKPPFNMQNFPKPESPKTWNRFFHQYIKGP